MSDTNDTRREVLQLKLALLPQDHAITFEERDMGFGRYWYAHWTADSGRSQTRYLGKDVDDLIAMRREQARPYVQRSRPQPAPQKTCEHVSEIKLNCPDCIWWYRQYAAWKQQQRSA